VCIVCSVKHSGIIRGSHIITLGPNSAVIAPQALLLLLLLLWDRILFLPGSVMLLLWCHLMWDDAVLLYGVPTVLLWRHKQYYFGIMQYCYMVP
jgi:hypothetical protein